MDGAFTLPLHIIYRPPGWLAGALLVSHTATIICILFMPVPILLHLVMIITVVGSCIYYCCIYLARKDLSSPVQLLLSIKDVWTLVDSNGEREVQLLSESLVHPALVVLRFKDNRHTRVFILTPGTVNPDILRRLRVRLRFGKNGSEPAQTR